MTYSHSPWDHWASSTDSTSSASTGTWSSWSSSSVVITTASTSTWTTWCDGYSVSSRRNKLNYETVRFSMSEEDLKKEKEREEERRRKAEELQRQKEEAEETAKMLLLDLIGEKELEVYRQTGRVFVKGRKYDYIIQSSGFVKRIEPDKITDLCIHLKDRFSYPETDNVIALKLLAEANEDLFLKTANVHRSEPRGELPLAACMN